ncbi:COP9 signalosome complex subunit 8 [Cavenderia fasciculata]|uniref:COP9 signalosome complex subunit 8 n=1 Tax=Cavenderia fasciculata TaxID=261658 RepID=F4PZG7_CACFS|nr:COP9 signalosome complex subunit 8 [Cavenderia fasciculata]EGG19196.1 COP9 signalosome complex subunit 8 [Cavenderia fasciculata]|eukprot:XP_004366829.1 COP9 signalosome complex subunit 8 [Cavenderia fasciculata]
MVTAAYPEIQKYLEANDFKNILSWCTENELRLQQDKFVKYYNVFLINYLIANDITNARFLWNRIPSEIKGADPHLKTIWALAKYISQLNYAHIYKHLAINFGPELAPFINELKVSFQRRVFDLISNSYSNISIKDASLYLGISPEEVVRFTQTNGWEKDPSSDSVKPVPVKPVEQVGNGTKKIHSLTDYIKHVRIEEF